VSKICVKGRFSSRIHQRSDTQDTNPPTPAKAYQNLLLTYSAFY